MAEIKLTCYDVLKQNKSITTSVTDYYKEYVQNDVLKQYITLSFTYNLRNFGGKTPTGEEDLGPQKQQKIRWTWWRTRTSLIYDSNKNI